MKRMRVVKVILVALAVGMVGAGGVVATTYIWNTTAGDWNVDANWIGSGFPDGTDDDAQIRILTGDDPEITITQDQTIDDLSIGRSVSFDTDTNGTVLTVDSVFITATAAGAEGVTVTIPVSANRLTIFAQGFDAGCLSN